MSEIFATEEPRAASRAWIVAGRTLLFAVGVAFVVLSVGHTHWNDVVRLVSFLGGAALVCFGLFGGFLDNGSFMDEQSDRAVK